MIDGLRVLAVIPARGGSKELQRKNVLPLAGRPLLAWTVRAALASVYLDRVVLSSDDPEIQEAARTEGCDVPFDRPADLALDTTSSMEVLKHALAHLPGYDMVVLLQPTSPLRETGDIDGCIKYCAQGVPSVVSVVELDKSPHWIFKKTSDGCLQPLLSDPMPVRRQDALPAYALNGAVYVARVAWLKDRRSFIGEATRSWEMPKERSIDIDTRLDMVIAEAIIAAGKADAAKQS
jgi:N-acylneuraminate cytidylyltransferase